MSYFDTSVLVAFYCPERLSSDAEKAILKDSEPAISILSVVEFASAISRKSREKTITIENTKSIWEQFNVHRSKGYYSILPLDSNHYASAASFIMQLKTPLHTLDALHLAIAADLSLTIVTADKILAKSAEKLNIPHMLVV
jgi:uncharacterized protein